jgi:hypothetical protein
MRANPESLMRPGTVLGSRGGEARHDRFDIAHRWVYGRRSVLKSATQRMVVGAVAQRAPTRSAASGSSQLRSERAERPLVREQLERVIENFDFDREIDKLDRSNLLYPSCRIAV